MSLSPKQVRIYDFIRKYIASNGESPTISEIGRQFQMTSSASIHAQIVKLERAGMITRIPNVARGIKLIEQAGTKS